MRFTKDGIEYRIYFHYSRDSKKRRKVTAYIENCDVDTEDFFIPDVLGATATCCRGDQFVKETGRKIALAKALKDRDREFRKAAWEAYFARKKPNVENDQNDHGEIVLSFQVTRE